MLTFKQSLDLLERWLADYRRLEELFIRLKPLTGGSPENEFHSTSWKTFDHYTAAVSALVGDEDAWLSWFLFDAPQSGRKPAIAKAASWKKPRPIRTVRQLLTLIRAK